MSSEDSFSLRHLAGQPASAEHFPEAAAVARAKIAELPDPHHRPADPGELVTNKAALAERYHKPQPVRRARRKLPSRLRPILTGLVTFAFLIALFKAPVIISQLNYIHHNPITSNAVTATTASAVVPPDPTITIPKLNVHAPVIYENTRDENQVLNDLQSGVVHYQGTANPGQPGNSVIFGHSSEDWWVPGNYKFVFVLLDKLQPGDKFSVDYQSTRYVYEVTGSRVVEPTDLSVLDPTSTPTMTLITCTPPGTSWKRLVVTAKQVLPNPSAMAAAAPAPAAASPGSLPGENSGAGFSKVTNFLDGVWQSITGLFGGASTPITSQQLPAAK